MNEELKNPPDRSNAEPECAPTHSVTDWLSFTLATSIVFAVYLWTLAPNVTLEFSGIFSTGAMFAGVPHPPGYPIWTLYSWLITKLIPFGNIAWRVAVGTAIAGAMASGLIALIVSSTAPRVIRSASRFRELSPREQRTIRMICGFVAGAAFGFDSGFWRKAVIVEVWPLSMMLFCITLTSFVSWFFNPGRTRYLWGAAFVYGLTITNSQALLVISPALLAMILVRAPKTVLNWKALVPSATLFALGASLYLYVPVASMSNPPVNWGYPRTAGGFQHTIRRGQYEQVSPTANVMAYWAQLRRYVRMTGEDFGWIYMVAATVPFCLLRRMDRIAVRWMISLTACFFCSAFVLLWLLNPNADRTSFTIHRSFFTASHVVLAIACGYGLTWIATSLNRSTRTE